MISADEIDRVYFRYPVPKLVTERFTLLPKWISYVWLWVALIFGPWIIAFLISRIWAFPL